jgi:hypothetical protein
VTDQPDVARIAPDKAQILRAGRMATEPAACAMEGPEVAAA